MSKRRSYAKFSPEQQAAIGRYASLHGNQAAIRHFSKQRTFAKGTAPGSNCRMREGNVLFQLGPLFILSTSRH